MIEVQSWRIQTTLCFTVILRKATFRLLFDAHTSMFTNQTLLKTVALQKGKMGLKNSANELILRHKLSFERLMIHD
jgi:hypothetical protein